MTTDYDSISIEEELDSVKAYIEMFNTHIENIDSYDPDLCEMERCIYCLEGALYRLRRAEMKTTGN